MSGIPTSSRRAVRHQATRDEIVDAAWDSANLNGLAGISMRDLGDRVNMRAQSIYTYYKSKFEIYDAMFAQGYQEFAHTRPDYLLGTPTIDDPAEMLRRAAHHFFDFCTENPVRYQLLFQRTIPGFEPSAESYQIALEVYESAVNGFKQIGIDDPEALDMWTALLTGLVDQQISNDPGGNRWRQLIDRSVEMFLSSFAPRVPKPTSRRVRKPR